MKGSNLGVHGVLKYIWYHFCNIFQNESVIFVWYLFIHSNCVDSMYTYLGGLAIWYLKCEVAWVQFPATIIFVYSKLSPIKDSVFQFLIKHLHICNKFSYRMSNHEIYSIMLYQNKFFKINYAIFLPFCSCVYAYFVIPKKVLF